MKRRGTSLLTVIMVSCVILALAFAAASLSTSNLLLTGRALNQATARNLAEAAIARTIAKLQADPSFGTQATPPRVSVSFANAPQGSEGTCTFDSGATGPYSTNNLDKDTSVAGWRATVVPAQTAHLVGTGRCAGSTHSVEAVIFLSRFPYAVASSGPIYSQGGLTVASLDEAEAAAQQEAGSLASNSKDPLHAVKLDGSGIEIKGDVDASGAILLGPEVRVGGAVRPNRDPVNLPKINLRDMDVLGKPGVANLSSDSFADLTVEGFTRIDRTLTVTSGGLDLQNGVLYVDGDLKVRGGIRGTGAVIATGSVEVLGGQEASNGKAALLSRGDIRLQGTSDQTQSFSGLLYTEGNLSSKYVDLSGVFVANRDSGSEVNLDNTNITKVSRPVVTFPVSIPGTPPVSPPGPGVQLDPFAEVQLGSQGNEIYTARAVVNVSALPIDPATGRYRRPADPFRAVKWILPPQLLSPGSPTEIPFANGTELTPYFRPTPGQPIIIPDAAYYALMLRHVNDNFPSEDMLNQAFPRNQDPSPSPTGSPGQPSSQETWTLDLSRFIQTRDRMRILIWREL